MFHIDPVFVPAHYTMVFGIDALALMRLNRSLLLQRHFPQELPFHVGYFGHFLPFI